MPVEFIVTTPSQAHTADQRRQIRSHATRSRPRKKGSIKVGSWAQHQPETVPESEASRQLISACMNTIPKRIGNDLSWVKFAEVMEPYMMQDVARFVTVINQGLYPPEICRWSDSVDPAWIGNLLGDGVLLNAMLYATEAYYDLATGREKSPRTQLHLLKVLRLLQQRVSIPDNTLAVSDPTIMAIVILALTSEAFDHGESVSQHIDGLQRMVRLRGGILSLRDDTRELAGKVSRVDISHSLRTNEPPVFLKHEVSWDRYLTETKSQTPPPGSADTAISLFVGLLDSKLANTWNDLKQLARLGNLATQSDRKITPELYTDTMVSLMYRLLHLSYETSTVQEALRTGILALCASMFFPHSSMKQGLEPVADQFRAALLRLRASDNSVPSELIFWLLIIWSTCSPPEKATAFDDWLAEIAIQLEISSWEQARSLLKSAVWIDALHAAHGRRTLLRAANIG